MVINDLFILSYANVYEFLLKFHYAIVVFINKL